MLVSMKEIVDAAQKGGYAVSAPNVYDEDTICAAIEAAEELNAPQILDFSWVLTPKRYPGVLQIAVERARRAKVPVALNQDHGGEFWEAVDAIRHGITSVMVDRSDLPFEENIAQVAEIAKFAHACGVSVEAELGEVGSGASYDGNAGLTDPAQAAEFVARTGVDCLAVAVGTAHGDYKGTPTIHFDRLAAIRKEVSVPLVLHGGSGSGDENLAKACTMGIAKVNVYTDLSNNALEALKSWKPEGKVLCCHVKDVLKAGYKEKLIHYMNLFGQVGKA